MKPFLTLLSILALVLVYGACQQSSESPVAEEPAAEPETNPAKTEPEEDPTPGEIVAHGVAVGRSGKPMTGARLFLAEIVSTDISPQAVVRLVDNVNTAVADKEGRFQFKDFTPGTYTIVYQRAGVAALVPQEIRIKTLSAATTSIAPGLINAELGKNKPFSEREWGKRFVLLEGHTLNAMGNSMTIRNASIKLGKQGPYLEWRQSYLWSNDFEDNSEVRFETWSY
jgi:hypothetical protein